MPDRICALRARVPIDSGSWSVAPCARGVPLPQPRAGVLLLRGRPHPSGEERNRPSRRGRRGGRPRVPRRRHLRDGQRRRAAGAARLIVSMSAPSPSRATEVTNAQFARFVAATGYVTTAERAPDWEELRKQLPPGTPKPDDALLVPGSMVFVDRGWKWTPGADWRHPEGPRQLHRRARAAPRGAGELGRRGGLREVGRRPAPHRGRVGVRRALGHQRPPLHLG